MINSIFRDSSISNILPDASASSTVGASFWFGKAFGFHAGEMRERLPRRVGYGTRGALVSPFRFERSALFQFPVSELQLSDLDGPFR